MSERTALTLYHRQGCHLCEQMLAELRALHGEALSILLVDVDGDAALRTRYGLEVPVLVAGEAILSRGRLDRERLEDYLTRG